MRTESIGGGGESTPFDIQFPDAALQVDPDQHEEWFEFRLNGQKRRLRIHDYDELYKVPGLYEALVYSKLKCSSPSRIARLLTSVIQDWPRDASDLRVLDLGAGNGIVAEELRKVGVKHVVGLDLLPEAAMAAKRDRPTVYDDYLVADVSDLTADQSQRMRAHRFNCLVTVAALGFGDIPPEAFAAAFNLVDDGGWIAMTIKEDFLTSDDKSGFAGLMQRSVDLGIIDVQAHHRYCHRVSITGEQLFYVAIVGRKTCDISEFVRDDIDDTGEASANSSATMLLGR